MGTVILPAFFFVTMIGLDLATRKSRSGGAHR